MPEFQLPHVNRSGVPRGSSGWGIAWDAAKSNRRVSSPARAWGTDCRKSQWGARCPRSAVSSRRLKFMQSLDPQWASDSPFHEVQVACRTPKGPYVGVCYLFTAGLASVVFYDVVRAYSPMRAALMPGIGLRVPRHVICV